MAPRAANLGPAESAAVALALASAFAACIPGFASRKDILGGGTGGAHTTHATSSTSASASTSASGGAGGTGGVASCSDGVQNQGETDVDCGGPCAGCALGKHCKTDLDCAFAMGVPEGGGGGSPPEAVARCADAVCVPPPKAAWESPTAAIGPLYRQETALTYDALDHVSVLYGGANGSGSGAQAWGWDGTAWHGLGAVLPPDAPTRFAPVLAYDAARGRTMVFGGWLPGVNPTYLNDALEWDGQAWTPLALSMSHPDPRGNAAYAFDANGKLMIFGGINSTGELGDTWLWDTAANAFAMVIYGASPAPTKRAAAAAAFDEARGVVVMFGGRAGGMVNAETWTWDGKAWTQTMPASSPSPRSDASMVYDRWRKRIVLFGGHGPGYPPSLADLWDWDGSNWTPLSATGTPPWSRNGPGMAFDDARGRVVLFGGDVSLKQDSSVYELAVWATPCRTNDDCQRGFCTDGLCCKQSSCNVCEACNVDPVSAGDCAQVPVGSADPRCDGGTCNAMGLCGP
jgi:hypothetical protein